MRTELIFRALADPTRLRIMRLLGSMELAVGEVAQVLGQSQPRVSRHIGILCDAGLAERRREGSWVFLRAGANSGEAPPLSRAVAELLVEAEAVDAQFAEECRQDRRKLAEIREHRESEALAYFSDHAEDWDELRRMHSSDEAVEAALARALEARPLGRLLDIGTGTGRMAELFAERAERIVALDKSLAMLRVARAKLQHLPAERVELVQGDFGSLPFAADSFDTVLFHQVLHFAQAPAAVLAEAARVTRPDGRVAIVDFAAHQREELRDRHAHARLGFEDSALAGMLDAAGFEPTAPIALEDGELVVKIWIAQRRAVERELAS
ncbi:ArsR/SmtB family transcription factor [Qipengyuania flava]|uniref:ArsR/SmtB family transcription factor n=1 Tax=Qipengyuania flava TaxID=192812 RepID=UPI001C58E844|nr:metalloregulator ArsR/SmtB family transcription factor [Qipengyuania flava]MBW3167366.1 metalloregulator ArsR/SmtB family transcription factor [Qipengyuania flava]MBY5964604.1 metalloregulator ArsR/SmtB family transcription factor [Qipengyuania flava]MBY6010928.1 metalloregulator ArsR/SmtB family transcription factor [Qipengyuania flava]MBY6025370.1 metalloregulator ArsR/SmtB family transcription factor [Qipengyuania flava]